MVIIDRLLSKTGDAHMLLGMTKSHELLDISHDAWENRLAVLQGLQFRQVRLAGKEVKVNFVSCSFEASEFQNVQSTGHFWAGQNRWQNCRFESVQLAEAISPMNSFRSCRFIEMFITNYKPYQTLFVGCQFDGGVISGLRAQLAFNQTLRNPDLKNSEATVVFRNCAFSGTAFEESFFAGIEFDACLFTNVQAQGCDFSGVISDQKWWPDQVSDPFTIFLTRLLDLIRVRCGSKSSAFAVFENYVREYKTGSTQSKDFSACLYTEKVPNSELDRIESELPKLMARFPF